MRFKFTMHMDACQGKSSPVSHKIIESQASECKCTTVSVVHRLINGSGCISIIIPADIAFRNAMILIIKTIGGKIEFILPEVKVQTGIDGSMTVKTTPRITIIAGFPVFL